MTTPEYARIGIAGTGRVARALAVALSPLSAGPVRVWGRDPARARACAAQVGAEVATDLRTLAGDCDLLAIAVADDAIPAIAEILAAASMQHAPYVFHVSGASGIGVLAPAANAGARTAAIHPAMTFAGDPRLEVTRMASATFAVTGADGDATAEGVRLVEWLGGRAVTIAEHQRPLYHAALCHASNHLVTLICGSILALERAGVDDPAGLLKPLVTASLENTLEKGAGALSGPLLRADVRTIATHLQVMDASAPALVPAYRAMALATLEQLRARGLATEPALSRLLEGDT